MNDNRTTRGEIVLQQLVVDEHGSPDVCEEQEDFLVWRRRPTCGRISDVGVQSTEEFDPSFRCAGVFDASPAARARGSCERRRHGGSRVGGVGSANTDAGPPFISTTGIP